VKLAYGLTIPHLAYVGWRRRSHGRQSSNGPVRVGDVGEALEVSRCPSVADSVLPALACQHFMQPSQDIH